MSSVPENLDTKHQQDYIREYCIIDHGEKVTIDRMFEEGIRKSYTKSNELIESIKKHKLKHINYFNKGKDYRISIAIEEKCEDADVSKVIKTRHKKRRSFQFKWMMFEFTETMDEDFKGNKSSPVYEVEIEICDNKYFNQYHLDVYYRLVERYVQNIESLIVAADEGADIFYDLY